MSANVTALKTLKAEVNEQTVDVLERALEEAKNGRIQEVALAVVYADGVTGWRRSGSLYISRLIGAAAVLLYQLNRTADED